MSSHKRTKLKALKNVRSTFQGTFVRYGTKPAYRGIDPLKTLLLENVILVETGQVVTDHLWFNFTKGFESLGELTARDVVQFDARATIYQKGYVNRHDYIDMRQADYKLSFPTKIKLLKGGANG